MTLPTPNWDGVELRWKGHLIGGSAVTGYLTVTADLPRFLDATDALSVAIFNVPIVVPIVDGYASRVVPVTDDPDITPNGFTYTIVEHFDRGEGKTFVTPAPRSAIATGIDLNKLISLGVG